MNNNDNIYCMVCNLYDIYKKNHNIEVLCSIETNTTSYFGTFVFDNNFVISNDSLILDKSCIAKSFFEASSHYDKTIISFDAIKAFSYKIIDRNE